MARRAGSSKTARRTRQRAKLSEIRRRSALSQVANEIKAHNVLRNAMRKKYNYLRDSNAAANSAEEQAIIDNLVAQGIANAQNDLRQEAGANQMLVDQAIELAEQDEPGSAYVARAIAQNKHARK